MSELVADGLLRIALVSGDAGAVQHLREALAGQVDIAYETSAAEFSPARAAAAGVTAALVNLDGGEWPEALEDALVAADLRAVFNDPDTSVGLEGWERARWLRHLVAKLQGCTDVDPPRPGTLPAASADGAAGGANAEASTASSKPLTTEEIDSLTADFAATDTHAASPASEAGPAGDALDIDTEALSAMIDARLAEPLPTPAEATAELPAGGQPAAVAVAAVADPFVAHDEDPALPALGDWELLDVEATPRDAKPSPRKSPAPAPKLPDSLADLELVPMESVAQLTRKSTEPVEIWLEDSKPGTPPRPVAGGGKA